MSTTRIQTVANTILDPRDVATVVAAMLCYQFHRATPASLPDEVHDAATGDGTHLPLDHMETNELIDLIKAGDAVEINTLGNDWEETGTDVQKSLEAHAAARTERTGDTVHMLASPSAATAADHLAAING